MTPTNVIVTIMLYKQARKDVYIIIMGHIILRGHANNSAVSTWVKTGLIQNENCVFEDRRVYFCKPTEPTVH